MGLPVRGPMTANQAGPPGGIANPSTPAGGSTQSMAMLDKIAKELGTTLSRILLPAAKLMGEAMKPLTATFQRIAFELAPLAKAIGATYAAFAGAASGILAAGQNIRASLAAVAQPFEAAIGGIVAVSQGIRASLTTVSQTFAGATRGIGSALGSALGDLLGPLKGVAEAAWAVMQPFQTLSGALMPFISALNPALAQALEYAMRELMATFGLLVQPIAQELVPLIKEVAATLQPAFRALAPMVASMAQVVGRVVALLARTFVTVLEAMRPAMEALVNVFSQMLVALTPLLTAFGALLSALGPILKALAESFTPALLAMSKAVTYATAGLMKFVGLTSVIDDMIKGLKGINKRGEQSNGLQAMRNVQYSSANDYGRTLALSATIAATQEPGEKKQTMDDMTKEILANLEAIRAGDTWGPLKKMLYDLGDQIIKGLKGGAYSAGSGAVGAAVNLSPVSLLTRAILGS